MAGKKRTTQRRERREQAASALTALQRPAVAPAPGSLAEQWTARRTRPIPTGELTRLTLPSGDQVTARRLNLASLLQFGHIPNALLPAVIDWLQTFAEAVGEDGEVTEEDYQDADEAIRAKVVADQVTFIKMLNVTWLCCVVDPVFVADEEYRAEPGVLPMLWVTMDNKRYLFEWAQGVDESAVEWFQRQPRAGVPDVVPSEGNGG